MKPVTMAMRPVATDAMPTVNRPAAATASSLKASNAMTVTEITVTPA